MHPAKDTIMKTITLLVSLCALAAPPVLRAQAQLTDQDREAVESAMKPIREFEAALLAKEAGLVTNYLQHLDTMVEAAKTRRDFETALAIQNEQKGWREGRPAPMDPRDEKLPLGLRRARHQLGRLTDQVRKAEAPKRVEAVREAATILEVLRVKLGNQDRLAAAVEVGRIRKELLEGEFPPPAPVPMRGGFNDLKAVAEARVAPLDGLAEGSRSAQQRQLAYARSTRMPLEVETRKTGIRLRLIPPGKFTMGSPPDEAGRDAEVEGEQVEVTLTRGFYLGTYEVTQAQWQAVMGSNPSEFKGERRPVEKVSWNDCQEFLKKLCELEGVPEGTYRLPTEAEWEYACRAGVGTAYAFGESLSHEQANFDQK